MWKPLGVRRRWIWRAATGLVSAALAALLAPIGAAAGAQGPSTRIQVITAARDHLAGPIQLYGVSGRMWIENVDGSITVLNAANGGLVKTFVGSPDGLGAAMAPSGSSVWAIGKHSRQYANLVELNGASAAVLRVLKVPSWMVPNTSSMQVSDGLLWACDPSPARVVAVNLKSGHVVHLITKGLSYGPVALQVLGGHVWVEVQSDLKEYDTSNGALLRSVPLPGGPLNTVGIDFAVVGPNLWVPFGSKVVVISAATGRVVKTVSGGSYNFDGSADATSDGGHVWIVNRQADSVSELAAGDYKLIQMLSGSSYALHFPAADRYYEGRLWIVSVGMFIGQGSATVVSTK